LSTNHRPQIIGTDHAIWRRIRLIPFTVRIPDEERDLDLPTKLDAEQPGILAWAIEGCREWLAKGEQSPPAVLQATAEYRRDMDALANWLEDRCELRPGVRTPAKELYADYVTYCDGTGEEPLKQRTFATRLTERGCGETRTGTARFRTGIRLRNPNDPNQAGFDDITDQDRDAMTQRDVRFDNLPREDVSRVDTEPNVTLRHCVTGKAGDDKWPF
jgi:putative DNA primase/helicase